MDRLSLIKIINNLPVVETIIEVSIMNNIPPL